MKTETDINLAPKNFYDIYTSHISPKLKNIDILVKTSSRGLGVSETARVLEISEDEVHRIMREEKIAKITKKTFYIIMKNGSSEICRYFSREVKCGSPLVYTRTDIAYIYDLNIEDVIKACNETGIKEATAFTLPRLFLRIPVA